MHSQLPHIRLMLDCAEICQTSANFMLRGSEMHIRTCAICREICEKCAKDCEQMDDDEQMKACAQMCRTCAETCRQMSMAG